MLRSSSKALAPKVRAVSKLSSVFSHACCGAPRWPIIRNSRPGGCGRTGKSRLSTRRDHRCPERKRDAQASVSPRASRPHDHCPLLPSHVFGWSQCQRRDMRLAVAPWSPPSWRGHGCAHQPRQHARRSMEHPLSRVKSGGGRCLATSLERPSPARRVSLRGMLAPIYTTGDLLHTAMHVRLSRFMVYCASHERRHLSWRIYGSPMCSLARRSSWI